MRSLSDFTQSNSGRMSKMSGLNNWTSSSKMSSMSALKFNQQYTCSVCSTTEDYECPLVDNSICTFCCKQLREETTCKNTKCEWYKS